MTMTESKPDQYGKGEALRDIQRGYYMLNGAVDKGAENLIGDRYPGSVRDDDHIADAKSFLASGHTTLAQAALARGDSAAAVMHLAAALNAASMPDPDHSDTSRAILAGAKTALVSSASAIEHDEGLSWKEANS